jgi:hypothetical protein
MRIPRVVVQLEKFWLTAKVPSASRRISAD